MRIRIVYMHFDFETRTPQEFKFALLPHEATDTTVRRIATEGVWVTNTNPPAFIPAHRIMAIFVEGK